MRRHHLRYATITAAAMTALSSMSVYAGTTAQPTSGAAYGSGPYAGNTNGNNYATISLSGSTALRNFTTAAGFTFLPNGSTIFLSSGTFTANGYAGQLAPQFVGATSTVGANGAANAITDIPAVRLEWHEQGSVEGDLELVTDQIYGGNVNSLPAGQAPFSLVTRAPTVSNPIWLNRDVVIADNNPTGVPPGTNGTSAANYGWTYGTTNSSSTATTGQSPIQMAIADVKPIQSFSVSGGTPSPFAAPATPGYGKGNPLGAPSTETSGLGIYGARNQLVDQTTLNITGNTGPWNTGGINNLQTNTVAVTATTFTANPGTGLSNLSTTDAQFLQLTGRLQNGATFQMSTRDVNSGTRNTAATNTGIDPSWAVGVNDGGNTLVTTVATAADSQDQINRTTTTAADGTSIALPTIRYSGKTSGGVLRTTIANARMGVGTLSLPDSISTSGSQAASTTGATPTDVLSLDGVLPTFNTITDGTYKIWQQEQYVTVKNTPASLSGLTQTQWANTSDLVTGIKGDTPNVSSMQVGNFSGGSLTLPAGSRGGYVVGQVLNGAGIAPGTTVTGITYNNDGTIASVQISDPSATGTGLNFNVSGGDVANFRNNVINSVEIAGGLSGFGTVNNPGDQLIAKSFILPEFMKVTKPYDGQATSPNTPYDINSNPDGYLGDALHDAFAANALGKGTSAPNLAVTFPGSTTGAPSTIGSTPSIKGYYGAAQRGAGQAGTNVVASAIVPLTNGDIAISPSNYLFGNFANNGLRDFNSFQFGFAAFKALYNSGYGIDAFDNTAATGSASDSQALTDAQLGNSGNTPSSNGLAAALGPESTFVGQRGSQTFSPTETSYGTPNAYGAGVTKGDLIVMGDYNGDGRFDGQDIKAMAIGTALSENTSTSSLTSMADVTTGVLRKNAALDYVQTNTADATYNTSTGFAIASNASAYLRQSARVVLNYSTTPAGATFLFNTSTGQAFTYDQSGANAFNKSDVNQDGVVDFNDALVVDNSNGLSYTNVSNSVLTSEPTPITGTPELANLVMAQQVDGETTLGAADLAVLNTALTGTGTTNWYNYASTKTGPGTIIFNRSSSTVNVYGSSSLQISSGTIQVASVIDPFTQNSNTGNPSSLADTSRSLAITVTTGGKLEYSGGNNPAASGIQVQRLSNLNISSGIVTIDPASVQTNRTVLVTGGLSVTGKLDLGNSDMIVQGGNLPAINTLVASGYSGGNWNGSGISSASASADATHLTALGVAQSTVGTFDGVPSTASDVLVKYTYYGDANLDGKVDGSDYSKIDSAFVIGGQTGWSNGDFNYDGVINGSDYTLIDNAFNSQGAALTSAIVDPTVQIAAEVASAGGASVPEPTTLGLLGIGAIGLLGRRRRR